MPANPHLIDDTKLSTAVTPTAGAAGAANINGTILDMAGWDGVLVIVHFGTITAGAATSIKMQQDTVVGFGGAADLAGTGQTILDTDDDKVFYIDLRRPLEQFVRLVVLRATQNSVVTAVYLQYRSRNKPSVQLAAVAGEKWLSPAEGAA